MRDDVSIRELRQRGGEIVDRVAGGGSVRITRDGEPVAELRAIDRAPLSAQQILTRWSRAPAVDPHELRRDLDDLVDPTA